MAGVTLHSHVIEQTPRVERDQDHLTVYHISASSEICDRTQYLIHSKGMNPGVQLFQILRSLDSVFVKYPSAIIGVSCITFHAQPIFDVFTKLLRKEYPHASVLSIEDELVKYLKKNAPSVRNVGILTTVGSRTQGVFRKTLSSAGFELIEASNESQTKVMDAIYSPAYGIKAVSPVTYEARKMVEERVERLLEKGAEMVVLGCTELPIAIPRGSRFFVRTIDPMKVLAQALIERSLSKSTHERIQSKRPVSSRRIHSQIISRAVAEHQLKGGVPRTQRAPLKFAPHLGRRV